MKVATSNVMSLGPNSGSGSPSSVMTSNASVSGMSQSQKQPQQQQQQQQQPRSAYQINPNDKQYSSHSNQIHFRYANQVPATQQGQQQQQVVQNPPASAAAARPPSQPFQMFHVTQYPFPIQHNNMQGYMMQYPMNAAGAGMAPHQPYNNTQMLNYHHHPQTNQMQMQMQNTAPQPAFNAMSQGQSSRSVVSKQPSLQTAVEGGDVPDANLNAQAPPAQQNILQQNQHQQPLVQNQYQHQQMLANPVAENISQMVPMGSYATDQAMFGTSGGQTQNKKTEWSSSDDNLFNSNNQFTSMQKSNHHQAPPYQTTSTDPTAGLAPSQQPTGPTRMVSNNSLYGSNSSYRDFSSHLAPGGQKSILDDLTFAPPPKMPGHFEQRRMFDERSTPHMPSFSKVKHSGMLMARFSMKSQMTKKLKQIFWIAYENHQVLFFRSKVDFEEWISNPYLSAEERNGLIKQLVNFYVDSKSDDVKGYNVTPIENKTYKDQGLL